ncbi:MAG: hypothetical protein ACOYD0_12110 [Candidatus Nanopelagicales bacterium]
MRLVHVLRIGAGLCVGLVLGGVATASAAKLGNLTAQTQATSATVVASCDSSIAASWDSGSTSPVWLGDSTPTNSTYSVTKLELTGIAGACNGLNYKAVLANSTGTAIQSFAGSVSGTSLTLTLAATDSKNVEQIVLTIYG